MQIQAQGRTETANCRCAGLKRGIDIGVTLKDFAEPVLHDDREANIAPMRFQQVQSGGAKNAISEGAHPDNGDSIAGTKPLENVGARGQ